MTQPSADRRFGTQHAVAGALAIVVPLALLGLVWSLLPFVALLAGDSDSGGSVIPVLVIAVGVAAGLMVMATRSVLQEDSTKLRAVCWVNAVLGAGMAGVMVWLFSGFFSIAAVVVLEVCVACLILAHHRTAAPVREGATQLTSA